MARPEGGERVLATNRKAFFQYHVLEKAEAGIALTGTEVKSVREGGLSFSDSYVDFRGGELFLVGCRIAPYSHGNQMNHVPDRDALFVGGRFTVAGGGGASPAPDVGGRRRRQSPTRLCRPRAPATDPGGRLRR